MIDRPISNQMQRLNCIGLGAFAIAAVVEIIGWRLAITAQLRTG